LPLKLYTILSDENLFGADDLHDIAFRLEIGADDVKQSDTLQEKAMLMAQRCSREGKLLGLARVIAGERPLLASQINGWLRGEH